MTVSASAPRSVDGRLLGAGDDVEPLRPNSDDGPHLPLWAFLASRRRTDGTRSIPKVLHR
jgi:hypothetical protein